MRKISLLLSAMATMAMGGCGAEDPVSVSSSPAEDRSTPVAKLILSGGTAGGRPFRPASTGRLESRADPGGLTTSAGPVGGTNEQAPAKEPDEGTLIKQPSTDNTRLIEALRTEGAIVERAGEVDQPFFSVIGEILTVNGSDVQVFGYTDAEEAEAEAALVSLDGSIVGTSIIAQFDRALGFCEGLARVAVDEKHGYINETGEIVIPLKFDEAYPFREGLAGARVEEKFGFIDKTGDYVITPQFDSIEPFSEGRAAVRVGEKWGFIDREGHYVADPQFDKVWHFSDGVASVNRGKEYGYIDKYGKSIFFWDAA